MAHLNHKGPEESGPGTGRKLGLCKWPENEKGTLGTGQAKGRNSSHNGSGSGKRRKAGAAMSGKPEERNSESCLMLKK